MGYGSVWEDAFRAGLKREDIVNAPPHDPSHMARFGMDLSGEPNTPLTPADRRRQIVAILKIGVPQVLLTAASQLDAQAGKVVERGSTPFQHVEFDAYCTTTAEQLHAIFEFSCAMAFAFVFMEPGCAAAIGAYYGFLAYAHASGCL